MTEEIRGLIDTMATGNTEEMMSSFDDIMMQKVANAVEFRKQEIASSLFAEDTPPEVEEVEEVSDIEDDSSEEFTTEEENG